MKKSILMVAGMLMIDVAVNAQTDSTLNSGQAGQSSTMQKSADGNQYRSENRVRVPSSQIPASLRQSLKGSEYKGWENSTIYMDKTTGDYFYESNSKTYRFDKNGKALGTKSTTSSSSLRDDGTSKSDGSYKSDGSPEPSSPTSTDGSMSPTDNGSTTSPTNHGTTTPTTEPAGTSTTPK